MFPKVNTSFPQNRILQIIREEKNNLNFDSFYDILYIIYINYK